MYVGDKALGLSASEEKDLDDRLDISSTRKNLWIIALTEPVRYGFLLVEESSPPKAPVPAPASQNQQPVTSPICKTHIYELTATGARHTVSHTVYDSPGKLLETRRRHPTYQWRKIGTLKYRFNFEAVLQQVAYGLPESNGSSNSLATEFQWIKACIVQLQDSDNLPFFEAKQQEEAPRVPQVATQFEGQESMQAQTPVQMQAPSKAQAPAQQQEELQGCGRILEEQNRRQVIQALARGQPGHGVLLQGQVSDASRARRPGDVELLTLLRQREQLRIREAAQEAAQQSYRQAPELGQSQLQQQTQSQGQAESHFQSQGQAQPRPEEIVRYNQELIDQLQQRIRSQNYTQSVAQTNSHTPGQPQGTYTQPNQSGLSQQQEQPQGYYGNFSSQGDFQ